MLLRNDAMKVLIAVATSVLLSCGATETRNADESLTGTYELKSPSIGSPRLMTISDRLEIHGDRTYKHEVDTVAGQRFVHTGTWSYSDRSITLDSWRDYAGVTSRSPRGTGQVVALNCIVELSRPPVIVVDPDQNIFYRQDN